MLDYLAEVTMSILQKQRQQDPELGYARDFPPLIGRIGKKIRERHIKVVANAGGVNPLACARAVLKAAPGLKIAVVLGDDVLGRIDEFLGKGYAMRNIDTGERISTIREQSSAPTLTSARSRSPKPWRPAPTWSSPAAAPTPPWCLPP